MVKAIRISSNHGEAPRLEAELDRQLRSSASYRLIMRLSGWIGLDTEEERMTTWNDLPWRRKSEVVAMLEAMADRLEAGARRQECDRLEYEIQVARRCISDQTAYTEALEAQVASFWRRRKHNAELKQRREELEVLKARFNRSLEQLEEARAA